jgi:GST-like protein
MIDLYYKGPRPTATRSRFFSKRPERLYKIFPIKHWIKGSNSQGLLKIAPNNRNPAMIDHEPQGGGAPVSMFESGAMLLYLADKTKKFIPAGSARTHRRLIEWLFWQMANLGPELGTEQSLQQLRGREDSLRDGPLSQ